ARGGQVMAAWMVYASLLGPMFGLAALGVERAARALRLSWFPGRMPWAVSMVATIVLPVVLAVRAAAPAATDSIAPSLRGAPVSIIARGSTLSLDASRSVGGGIVPGAREAGVSTARRGFTMPVVAVPPTPRLDRALLAAWLACVLVILAVGARSTLRFSRRRRSWPARLVLDTPVLVASDFGPALVGVFRPEIVLPEWVFSLDDASLALLLRHEAEHRRARDTLLLGACGCVAALCPWNVSLWWQLARLRLA